VSARAVFLPLACVLVGLAALFRAAEVRASVEPAGAVLAFDGGEAHAQVRASLLVEVLPSALTLGTEWRSLGFAALALGIALAARAALRGSHGLGSKLLSLGLAAGAATAAVLLFLDVGPRAALAAEEFEALTRFGPLIAIPILLAAARGAKAPSHAAHRDEG
jgi:hypothetical protein